MSITEALAAIKVGLGRTTAQDDYRAAFRLVAAVEAGQKHQISGGFYGERRLNEWPNAFLHCSCGRTNLGLDEFNAHRDAAVAAALAGGE